MSSYPNHILSMRGPLCWLGTMLLGMAATSARSAETTRPNVVFLLADDLGWADLGCYGAPDIRTPHIDQLARQGVRFTSFYTNGPECTPTRAALMTGRYQQRVGGLECAIGSGDRGRYDDAIRLAEKHELGLPVSETSIARLLKDAGYATALVGKWHLGYQDKFSPNRHGFDHALYCVAGNMDYFHHVEDPPVYLPALRLDGKTIQRQGYFTDIIADDAVKWLDDHAAKDPQSPFFLYVPFTAPHTPFQGPGDKQPRPLPADSPLWKQGKAPPRVYAAMIEREDDAVGQILAALDRHHLSGNTLVIFASDNGGTGSARPAGLRGVKGMTFEGGIRVPAIVRWPGNLPENKVVTAPVLSFDFTASIAAAAGVKPAKDRPFDGIDVLRYVKAGTELPARPLFWRERRADLTWRAVRENNLKYVSRQEGAKFEEWLFDIEADRGELHDLLAQHPTETAHLKKLLADWEVAVRPTR